MDLKKLTIEKAHEDLKNGVYTCRQLAEAYLKVIEEKNSETFTEFMEKSRQIIKENADENH